VEIGADLNLSEKAVKELRIIFTKMEGCGNDYVYIDCVKGECSGDRSRLAKVISDRHFGVGSDGLIFINKSDIADFEMEMYNADGSRSEMCGNGIRCVGKYVYDAGYVNSPLFTVESMGSIKTIEIKKTQNNKAVLICVDMGEPILEPEKIPVKVANALNEPITAGEVSAKMTCVSMGNPHAVIFTDSMNKYSEDLNALPIESIGPLFENHRLFPNRINTEFVKVINDSEVNMRVWERGTGETLACGTGCCATTVACILNKRTGREITVHLKGGEVSVRWDETTNHIFLTGPARVTFTGSIEIDDNYEIVG